MWNVPIPGPLGGAHHSFAPALADPGGGATGSVASLAAWWVDGLQFLEVQLGDCFQFLGEA
jgi:hypothetical protein